MFSRDLQRELMLREAIPQETLGFWQIIRFRDRREIPLRKICDEEEVKEKRKKKGVKDERRDFLQVNFNPVASIRKETMAFGGSY